MNRCHPVDLRHAFDLIVTFDGGDDDPDERDPDPSPPAEDANDGGDAAGGEGNGDTDAPVNPELKRLHDEAARHRVRARTAEDQVATLTDENRTLRLRLVFNEAAADADLTDTNAAWKLASDDLAAVSIDEDGTVDVTRLGQIIDHIADRYPYLVAAPAPTPEDQALRDRFPALAPSGASTDRRRTYDRSALDHGHLAKKFPALRRR